VFKPEDGEKTRSYNKAEFVCIPACGHNLHVKKSVKFIKVLGSFINRK
jgi:pimeloyl-ACP methyl ester carboxylesterase